MFGGNGCFTIFSKSGSVLFDQQGAQLFVTLNKADKSLKLEPSRARLIGNVGVAMALKDVAVNRATTDAIAITDKDVGFARVNRST